jgi:hypothetical protein
MFFFEMTSKVQLTLKSGQSKKGIFEIGPEMKNDIKSREGQNFDIISQLYHPLKRI